MNMFSSQSRSPAAYIQEARSLPGSGKIEDAILQLQTAVAYYPSDERLNRELIAHFARQERYMDAFRAAVAWYRNDGGNPNCLDTLADVAEVLGEKSDAELLQALVLARAKLATDANLPDATRQRVLEALDEQIARLTVSKK